VGPCSVSPRAKTIVAVMKTSAPEVPFRSSPPASTSSAAVAQRTFISASAAIRLRPSSAFDTGSWIRTMSSVLASQMKPTQRSLTPA
jgi:hypothetical protein